MKELIENINIRMNERKYILHSTNGDKSVLHYSTPIGEKPNICCDVFIKENHDIEFKFRYLTKRCVMLTTDKIGCFFDDNHFNKFEVDFWNLATTLYNFEYEDKGDNYGSTKI